MPLVFEILFWFTIILILSTYFFYPLVLAIFSKIFPYKLIKGEYYPEVSIIISAYNEERHIEQKIKNTLSIDYPKDKMEIIVGSDGSLDKTTELAEKYKSHGIKVLDFKINRGKTAVQNDCVKASRAGIIIFTDAASFFKKNAITELVNNFKDPKVGCVAGQLNFVNTEKNINTQSQGLYWQYELLIRKLESKLGRVIGVDGPLYAIRKSDYQELEHHVISDFISPLLVLANGKKVVFEHNAIIDEEPTQKANQEFNTRRRITLRAFQGLKTHKALLNPFTHFKLSVQLYFHKIFRWLVGIWTILNFISVLFLSTQNIKLYNIILILYIILIFSAGIGFSLDRKAIKIRPFSLPFYFILVNSAATLGFIDFLRNKQIIAWKPVR
jgi:poly-beta-1,6-N-acetyl-D-glucosamine synthase